MKDTTPDAFSLNSVTNAALGADITSNTITISGINTAADISISGGTYSIDGAAFVSTSGTVTNGQKIVVKVKSSALPATTTKATLTVGGVSGDFTLTTQPADTTPNAFSFTEAITTKLNTAINSNTVTISGINVATPISVVGGKYSVDGGAFTEVAGTVANGQKITVQAQSAFGIYASAQAPSLWVGL